MDTDLRTAQRRDRVAWLRGRVRRGDPSPIGCRDCGGFGTVHDVYPDEGETDPPRHLATACSSCQGTGRAPFAEAIELAAYCGDEAARQAVGYLPWGTALQGDLATWLVGLPRWPGALERAALAAVEAWWLGGHGQPTKGRQAIDAARDHITEPTAETRQRCGQFAPAESPAHRLCHFLAWRGEGAPSLSHVIMQCGDVRQAICDSLIGWTLA